MSRDCDGMSNARTTEASAYQSGGHELYCLIMLFDVESWLLTLPSKSSRYPPAHQAAGSS